MTKYQQGATFERYVKGVLEYCGFFVIRSAGSHGCVDLLAVKRDGCNVTVSGIQCKKYGAISWADKRRLIHTAKVFGFDPYLAYREAKGKPLRIEALGTEE